MIGGNRREKKGKKCALWTVKTLFRGREYKTLAHLGNKVVAGIKSPYLHLFLHYKQFLYVRISPLLISPHSVPCLRSGRGARSPAKADSERRASADGFAAKMKRTKAGCRVVKILFPVFGGEKAAAKIKPVNGLRVEIFRARCGKYYPSIDRLDSRNSGKSQTKANFKFPIDFNNV